MDPIALAQMQAAFATMLDMLEGPVQQAVARGYTDEQARRLVTYVLTQSRTEEDPA